MKKRKIISLCLATLITIISVSGCGMQKENTSADDSKIATVTVWTNNSHSKTVMNQLVNDWNNTKGKEKGIKIDYVVKGDDYGNQLQMAINADNPPDIFLQGATKENLEKNVIIALNDYLETEEFLKGYGDKLVNENFLFQGKICTVPKGTGIYGLVYNKDLFKEKGIVDENGEAKPPKTYQELVEYSKKLTNPDKKQYGIVFPVKWGGWTTTDIVYPALVSTGINSGYVVQKGIYDFGGIEPIMNTILQIKHDGSCYPGAESLDNDPARALFSEGRIGMKFSGDYDVGVFTNQFPAKCDWGVAPYPSEKADVRYKTPMILTEGGVISKNSVERIGFEKVFEVYKWYNSDELSRKLYQKGLGLPYDFNTISDIVDECEVPGMKAFAKLIETGHEISINPQSDVAGFDGVSIQSLCNTEFWYERKPITQTLETYGKACTEGIDRFFAAHPEDNKERYIRADWDNSLK